jgi:hypothetical protein
MTRNGCIFLFGFCVVVPLIMLILWVGEWWPW